MFARPLTSLVVGCAISVTASRLDGQAVSLAEHAGCWVATDDPLMVGGDPGCIPGWTDSLRSPVPEHRTRARRGLVAAGGRAAVDALRAEYERTPARETKLATIAAMATTGSGPDIRFLANQLQGPFTGNSDIWPATQSAATTLRFLRATGTREALAAALARYGTSGFAGRAVERALAELDRPPCVGTVSGDLEQKLVRIVMECGLESMTPSGRYRDASSGGTWHRAEGRWRLDSSAQLDSAAPLRVSHRVWLAPDRRQALVMVATWCGRLCGEAWMFRMRLTDDVWRVISGDMASVS